MSLDSTASSARSLTEALKLQKEASDGLFRSFGELANGIGENSKKWTAFSRVLSGSGLWKLQNYMRSLGQVMDFYYKKQDRAFEETQKSIRSVGKVQKQLQKVTDVKNDLNGASKSFTELSESIEEVADAYAMADAAGYTEQAAQTFAIDRTKKQYSDMHEELTETKKRYGSEVKKLLKEEEKQSALSQERETKKKLLAREQELKEMFKLEEKKYHEGFEMGQFRPSFGKTEKGAKLKKQISDYSGERRIDAVKEMGAGIKNNPLFKFLTLGFFNKLKNQPIFKVIRGMGAGFKAFRKIPFKQVMGMASKYALLGVMFLVQAFVIFSLFRVLVKDAGFMKTIVEGAKGILEGLSRNC